MTAQSILDEIRPLGRESYKKVFSNHGVKEPCFGVKIEDLKKIQKRIKKDYRLALELYDTGIYDAMYLAGLIADDAQMTKKDLRHWAGRAYCRPLAGSTVPWVASASRHGWEIAGEWIESGKDLVAVAGWATLSCPVSIKDDAELDLDELKRMLQRVQETIHQAPNAVRYSMNGFVIAVGAYVRSLTEMALRTGEKVGPVTVDMGNTACQVPFAPDYIQRWRNAERLGRNARP